ncbi:MAG: flippase-like domain-containing protein [Actinobacteria bacterium]|nr:flippase-like domain-containing protein [Actinomycetota bacterium]
MSSAREDGRQEVLSEDSAEVPSAPTQGSGSGDQQQSSREESLSEADPQPAPTGQGSGPDSASTGPAPTGTARRRDRRLATRVPTTSTVNTDIGAVVIEDTDVVKKVRRPLDLLRMIVALLGSAGVLAIAYYATATTAGIGEDIGEASGKLPTAVQFALALIAGIGIIAIPVATSINLLLRRRPRQLIDSYVSLLLAVVLLIVGAELLRAFGSDQLRAAVGADGDTVVFSPLLGGLLAFSTTARLMSRSFSALMTFLVLFSLVVIEVLGNSTLASIGVSLLVGWAIGLAVRYIFGTTTTRPSGMQVAQTLHKAHLPVTVLRAQETTRVGRRYSAIQRDGPELEILVLDRDLEGSGLWSAFWSTLRLRESSNTAFNMRRSMDQRTLMAYAATIDDIPAPRLLAVREIGPDSSLLAYERILGERLSRLTADDLDDRALDSAWSALQKMQASAVAHRRISPDNLCLTVDGDIALLGFGSGNVAASDLVQRMDVAAMLCSLAMVVGPDRALASGTRCLGADGLLAALPVLQPVALPVETRRALRKHKKLLVTLRDQLLETVPDGEVEQIKLERIRPRTVVMAVLLGIAAYFVVPQLLEANLVTVFTTLDWWWALVALGASIITYPAAAWSISGFVPEKLKLLPTALAQLAGDFVTLITPPTLGAVAINLRYLQKVGIHPALATASIGVAQVGAFGVHTLLLIAFGLVAGTGSDFDFHIPTFVFFIVGALVVVAAVALLFPQVRRRVVGPIGPLLKQVGPRLLTVAQTPMKLVEGFGGMLLLNAGYIACLIACCHAFGDAPGAAAIAVVYLTGSVVGQAAPTPGGLGAVELAMSAGLTAAGMDSGLAVSAVLLYRIITFWLPVLPGWLALNWLTKHKYV